VPDDPIAYDAGKALNAAGKAKGEGASARNGLARAPRCHARCRRASSWRCCGAKSPKGRARSGIPSTALPSRVAYGFAAEHARLAHERGRGVAAEKQAQSFV
jgi:hypothetical protein